MVKIRIVKDIILITLFLLGLYLPLADYFFNFDPTLLDENRALAKLPAFKIDITALSTYPKDFEAFYNDHFGFRRALIFGRSLAFIKLLGVSPNPDVIIGRDGWLFYSEKRALAYYRRVKLFTNAELAQWQQALEKRRDELAQHGSRYLMVIAPNKDTIYPEFMPAEITRINAESRMDQLVNYLQTHSDIDILDLRPALTAAKANQLVYYRTDTHWNQFGALIAYQEIIKRLAGWFPQLQPLPFELTRAKNNRPGGDLTGMINLRSQFSEENTEITAPTLTAQPSFALIPLSFIAPRETPAWQRPVATERKDNSLPTAVVIGDSFGLTLQPFLSEHFKRIAYYIDYGLDQETLSQILEQEQPDVVIHEFAERRFQEQMPYFLQTPATPALQVTDPISPELYLGRNWGALETDNGEAFHWVNNDAEIIIISAGYTQPKLMGELEAGPSLGRSSFTLLVYNETGTVVAYIPVTGRQAIAIQLPLLTPGQSYRYRLHVESQNLPVPNDPRLLNFRVFRLDWDN
jgi:alginate O-acetyltransferase complex protein AlgJ